ncbi:transporter, small conductance mechanosensitive ion channel (MscS) family [Myxococcus xanthus DK 1622]|uniref:Transporter, small conductance mechanosensitive ion channel (MscS) family n=2 Tax=Myxococcaceae TaxID=31 RepID=Q1DEP9_MYXXD|nr:transporter, small conductance mechanosensitive ion channel (MscS) family [Myxococcus xanthus DK 1622]
MICNHCMEIFRLADTVELNNAWLVGLSVTLMLLALWALLVASSALLYQGIRLVGLKVLEQAADALRKRARLSAALLSFVVVVAGIAVLGFSLWAKKDLAPHFNALLGGVTAEGLADVGRGAGLLVLLMAAFLALERAASQLLVRVERRLNEWQLPPEHRAHAQKAMEQGPGFIKLLLAYFAVGLALASLQLPAVLDWLIGTTLFVLLAISGGRLAVSLLHLASERLVGTWAAKSTATKYEEYFLALGRLLPVGQKSLEAIVYISVATLVIRRFQGLEFFAPYGPVLIRVIALFFAASVVVEFVRLLIARAFKVDGSNLDDAARRRNTFVSLIQSASKYLVYFLVGMMVLSDLGVDPTPILAGAGIVGLTVGLGSQAIVTDMVNGVFLLFEDQILNGDYIRINDTEGVVEEITPRITRIRDRFGRLHILRNGEVKNVINYSRGWTLAIVDMAVAYESDLKKVMDVIRQVCEQVPMLSQGKVSEIPKLLGIESMDESWMTMRIEAKVQPGTHFDVKRLLNRLLIEAFTANGLEFPYPKGVEYEGGPLLPATSEAPQEEPQALAASHR